MIAAQLEAEFPSTNRGIGADAGRQRANGPSARKIDGLLVHDAGRRHRRPADRLRQRLEPAHRARVPAPARSRGAHGARRREASGRTAASDRSPRCWRPSAAASASSSVFSACAGSRVRCRSIRRRSGLPSTSITAVPLFVAGVIVMASLLAGALPAMHAARVSASAALKDDSRSSTSGRLGRFSGGLVVAELAVWCALLIAAGLMVKSVVQLKTVEMPFAIDNILTARVDPPAADIRTPRRASGSSRRCCPSCTPSPGSRPPRCPTVCRQPGTAPLRCRRKGLRRGEGLSARA